MPFLWGAGEHVYQVLRVMVLECKELSHQLVTFSSGWGKKDNRELGIIVISRFLDS